MKLSTLIKLIRPPSLVVTLIPVIIGGAISYSYGLIDSLPFLVFFAVALLMQMSVNIFNEYADFKKGLDKGKAIGFSGVITNKEISAKNTLLIGISFDIIALIGGIWLVYVRGIIMLFLGIVAALANILYSFGPVPISQTPLGDIVVFFICGPIEVVAAALSASGIANGILLTALIYSIPVGLLATSTLMANNLRDIKRDKKNGRKTSSIVLGKKLGFALFFIIILAIFLWSIPILFYNPVDIYIVLIWAAFPIYLYYFFKIYNGDYINKSTLYTNIMELIVGLIIFAAVIL
jgi:1,4-dihydroxy-2-naphthoate octaprenyltransferase